MPIERPRVTYRPFTDEDRAKAAADVERWEREGLLVPYVPALRSEDV